MQWGVIITGVILLFMGIKNYMENKISGSKNISWKITRRSILFLTMGFCGVIMGTGIFADYINKGTVILFFLCLVLVPRDEKNKFRYFLNSGFCIFAVLL